MAGRPEKVADTDILTAIIESSGPVASSSEVADRLPVIQKTAEKRLSALYERGLVDRKKIGRAYAWWITEDGETYLQGELDESELGGDDG